MAEGIVEDTVTVIEKYPVWILGGLLVAVLVIWYMSGSSSAAQQGAQFQFSYGPSDAQVTAGMAAQIAQTQANGAATVAQTNATAATSIAGDYYNYLATNSANTLAGTVDTNSVTRAVDLAQINGQTATSEAQAQAEAAASAAQIQINAQNQATIQGQTYYNALTNVWANNVKGFIAEQNTQQVQAALNEQGYVATVNAAAGLPSSNPLSAVNPAATASFWANVGNA